MLFDEYVIIGRIDRGVFEETFKASKKGCKGYFSIDKIKKHFGEDHFVEEVYKVSINTIKDLNHSNVIKMIDFKEDSNYYYCIYDYCNGGDLSHYLEYLEQNNKSFSEKEVQYIMKQLVESIKYLHNKKIVHRDIRPRNILLNYNSQEDLLKKDILKAKIKLAGFDISTPLEKGKVLDTFAGTRKYISPEIIYPKDYNEKIDIWSLGITFCELLSCKTNFNYNNKETYKQIPYFQNISKEANSFINCTLQYDPEKRISAEELSKHEFLTKDVKNFSFPN